MRYAMLLIRERRIKDHAYPPKADVESHWLENGRIQPADRQTLTVLLQLQAHLACFAALKKGAKYKDKTVLFSQVRKAYLQCAPRMPASCRVFVD